MTALEYLLGVVLFVIGVAASIGLHELGHLIPGKLFDIKITQYFVGFGRTIWSKRIGETEYGVKAIPLGGYVKLVGMLPPAKDDDPDLVRSRATGMFAQVMNDARAAEYEHVGPEDDHRLFYNQAVWKRIVIMASGVATNLVIAFLLYAVLLMGYGIYAPSAQVASVSECVKAVHVGAEAGACTASDPASPARLAGVQPGDVVLSFGGTAIHHYDDLQRLIRANGSRATVLVVSRGGQQLSLPVTTAVTDLPGLTDPNQSVRAGFLGVTPVVVRQHQPVAAVFSTMGAGISKTATVIAHAPNKLYHVGRAAFGLEKRDPNGPMSVVGAGRVAGELTSSQGTPFGDRMASILALIAGLNLFLALLNIVPLPPFDGAGVATALIEIVQRRWAALRGRPDPGPFDSARLLPVTYTVAGLLIGVSVILIYADIVAPVSLS